LDGEIIGLIRTPQGEQWVSFGFGWLIGPLLVWFEGQPCKILALMVRRAPDGAEPTIH